MEVSYPGRSLGPTGRFLKGHLVVVSGATGPLKKSNFPKNLSLDKLDLLSPALAVSRSSTLYPRSSSVVAEVLSVVAMRSPEAPRDLPEGLWVPTPANTGTFSMPASFFTCSGN